MHWVGYDHVYKQGSITQEINVNQLSIYEELWVVLALIANRLGQRVRALLSQLLGVDNKRDLVLFGDHPWEYVTLLF